VAAGVTPVTWLAEHCRSVPHFIELSARMRVGTVHAFQGAEADHVVLVLGVGPSDPPGRRRFVEDPHLFNVMVTRARRSLVVVTSLTRRTHRPPTR